MIRAGNCSDLHFLVGGSIKRYIVDAHALNAGPKHICQKTINACLFASSGWAKDEQMRKII